MRPGREARRRRQSGALERLRVDRVDTADRILRGKDHENDRRRLERMEREIATLESRLGLSEVRS